AEALSHLKADAYGASGGAHSIASGRISYLLGLHGPNFALDTACSSSMVAIHCGVRALREGDADLVLAGGVTMTLSASGSIVTSRARMMSFDGRCKTFDAAADGYVRGEGCAMLAMKRLSDAERDGDRIVAVIRGTAINQDGRSTGMTAPNGRAQTAVLRAALDDAGLKPRDVNYIEAHGTGTSLGDPIELNALGEAYGDRPADEPLHVASVKTNIGHTEGAAGIAGVIKTAMAMRAREIAPHLNLETPNPLIPWDSLPVEVPLALTPWQAPAEGRLRAGVSSFGFSGTNAHLVMEEAPEPPVEADAADRPGREHTLLALSGRAREAVDAMAGRLAAHMEAHPEIGVGAVAAELGLGRSHLNQRLALPVNGRADALAKLQAAARGETPEGAARDNVRGGEAPATVFLFTGQGSQYAGMARELYDGEPVFRAALDRCAAALEGKLPRPLLPVVFGETSEDAALLDDTTYTQPALFAVEWSLAELWKSWGVVPAAAMGHSVGEYVAACVAGVFSLEDGLALIAERARLMGSLPRDGAMAAVLAPEPVVRAALVGREADCAVAAVNGPENTVIAGRTETVEAILEALAAERIAAQRLTVSHAFHSPLMDPILAEFEAAAAGIAFSAPEITLISNVTGGLAGDEILTPGYWRRHLRDAVRFSDSVGTLLAEGYESFLEIGPAPVLSGMARHCPGAEKARWQGSLRKGRGERATMLAAAAALYAHGAEFDWAALQGGGRQPRNRCRLPTYAFQRERYWPDFDTRPSSVAASRSGHPYLSGAASGPVRVFRATLDLSQTPWLGDHRIYGFAPFPAAGFVDLALTAAGEARGGAVELRDVELRDSLMLPDEGAVEMQVIVGPAERGVERVRIYSQEPLPEGRADGGESPEPQWRLHVVASVGARRSAPAKANGQAERWTATPAAPADATGLDVRAYYDWLSDVGVDYGPAFQAIETIEHSGSEVWGDVRLPEHLSPQGFAVHPVIVDACSQIIGGHQLDPDDPDLSAGASMPVAIGAIRVLAPVPRQARCHVIDRETGDEDLTRCDFALFDTEGALVLEVEGLEYRRVSRDALNRIANVRAQGEWHFELDWEAQTIATAARSEAPGRWLLLADESGVADRLAAKLIAQGATVAFARRGEGFSRSEAGWVLDGRDPGALHRLVAEAEQDGPLAGIVDLWPLDLAGATALEGPDALEATHAGLLAPALGLVQAAAGKGTRIWFVTRGAQSVQGEGPDLAQAPLLAFAGVVATEQPDTPTVRIDLDPRPGPAEDALLFDAIWTPDDEDQTAFRGETRLAARLAVGTRHAAPESEPVFLHITERGVLENLTLAPLPRSAPGPNEVELRVVATGVNFRDVLNTLGMYPGDPGPLGSECAGVVSAVGAAVEGFAVGDEVVAMIDRSFATFAKADASLVVKKPATLSMAEAAGTPVAFLTADYALRELGKVQPGERVLIHAITGGVGMAAAQIARSMGAEVYGTAGTPAKRAMALAQ
ncbi:MAG: acyltransferase domain-containing protein, partial [Pseudomonadota bacterium]